MIQEEYSKEKEDITEYKFSPIDTTGLYCKAAAIFVALPIAITGFANPNNVPEWFAPLMTGAGILLYTFGEQRINDHRKIVRANGREQPSGLEERAAEPEA